MIGLDIRVKNEYNNYLYKIFSGINLSEYDWEINTDDFLYSENGKTKQNLFGTDDILGGDEFFKCISRDSYYMIFADIKAYPQAKERVEIKNYKDFVESNCELVLLCTDSTFIELYSKDKNIIDKIYNNCIGSEFEKVAYLSIEEISKRGFTAW